MKLIKRHRPSAAPNLFEQLMSLSALKGTRTRLKNSTALNSKNSWYEFLCRLVDKILDNDTAERASSVAFNLMLAVFPTFIFLFTLIPYMPSINEQEIMDFFAEVLPGGTFDTVGATIQDIISRPRSGVLSFGFLLALYSATSGMVALMNAFNSSHEIDEERTFLSKRLVAVGLTITLALALFLAITLLVVGGVIIEYLAQYGFFSNEIVYFVLKIARYLLVFAVFVGVLLIIYRYGPDVHMKWAFITPGSVTASVLIVLTTLGFSYYVSNFGSYNKVYGSIGTLIALMIWINLVSLLLIIGFEINVCLYDLEGDRNPSVTQKTTNATSNS
ncbi:ribonuclease BN [Fibrella aestuarina BUZ 2]|uniref:Ribonuclease BN n=1 Tax=Fibrella aestuarina BUZ 2 TaxID=1166018 RepID=I0K678_9BACT|nr:YihY/virulence factor BrkB family protein [Fibrella aestuarina]CCG99631.1 ribonuclease BN [Fibrella aestuarina BUZ 2]